MTHEAIIHRYNRLNGNAILGNNQRYRNGMDLKI